MINHQTLGLFDTLTFGAPPVEAPSFMAPEVAAPGYSLIYAFGDSLSDAGNDYIATAHLIPTSAIYDDGRFSNGPVWVEDLAKTLGLPALTPSLAGGTDFAYGGAYAGAEPQHTVTPIDLPSQLAQFLVDDPTPSPNALYTLSIGANDLLSAIPLYASNPTAALNDVAASVRDEGTFINALALDGAKNFLILNVPNLGVAPAESGDAATATKLSLLYDLELNATLTKLGTQDHLSIHLVNSYALIDEAVAHPADFGLKNVTTPVWTGNYEDPTSGTLNATGAAQNTYLFFDSLHPTERGHLALAALAHSVLG
jgi:phospholipase/lecithinase/hemolysin